MADDAARNLRPHAQKGLPPCKLSVILPVCNMEAYLKDALQSAVANACALGDAEILVVDDGSEDGSLAVARSFAEECPEVRVVSQRNLGPAPAKNHGLALARGEYVAFLDADDFYPAEDTLLRLYGTARAQGADICGGSLATLSVDGTWCTEHATPYERFAFQESGWHGYDGHQFPFGYQAFLYRKGLLDRHGIRFPSYRRFEDPVFFVRAMLAAGKFYALRDIAYIYRVGYKSIRWTGRKARDLLRGLSDVLAMAKQHGYGHLYRVAFMDYLHYERTNAFPAAIAEAASPKERCRILADWMAFAGRLDPQILAGGGIRPDGRIRRILEQVVPYIDIGDALTRIREGMAGMDMGTQEQLLQESTAWRQETGDQAGAQEQGETAGQGGKTDWELEADLGSDASRDGTQPETPEMRLSCGQESTEPASREAAPDPDCPEACGGKEDPPPVPTRLDLLEAQITALEMQVKDLAAECGAMCQMLAASLPPDGLGEMLRQEDGYARWFSLLRHAAGTYLVLLAVRDTPGDSLPPGILREIVGTGFAGFRTDLWRTYAGAVQRGSLLREACCEDGEPSGFRYKSLESSLFFELSSRSWQKGDMASICVSGEEMAVNLRGVNIVVYDVANRRLVDSVGFDAHEEGKFRFVHHASAR